MFKGFVSGHLTKDVELMEIIRANGNNLTRAVFYVANNRINKDGERRVDFIKVAVFGKYAELCANHLKKGSGVIVSGNIEINSYARKDGMRVTEVEMIGADVGFTDKKNPISD